MKRAALLCAAVVAALVPAAVLANSAPVVTNVVAAQRDDDSKLVDIHYDLADANGNSCTVWVAASGDGGATWCVPVVTVAGDVGPGIAPGLNHHIIWDAGADAAGIVGAFRVRVYADDGQATGGLVLISGGQFAMGDHLGDSTSSPSPEEPVHVVSVDTFLMGSHEVTNQQYAEFLNNALSSNLIEVKTDKIVYRRGTSIAYCSTYAASLYSRIAFTGSTFVIVPSDKADHPMAMVSWFGAAAYCNWRSEQLGKETCYDLAAWTCDFSKNGVRLPTEAEWEYAARGGATGRRFPWGDTISHTQANYYSSTSYSYDVSPTRQYHPDYSTGDMPYTAATGSFAANGYGLHDVTGNVWEWCNDWYQSDYYTSSPYSNPQGPETGTYRAIRGGAWSGHAASCRVAYRIYSAPDARGHFGFRVVLDVQ